MGAKKVVGQAAPPADPKFGKRRACPTILASRQRSCAYFNFASSALANFCRPSRICARVQAANPKVRAGFISAFIKQDDNGDGRIPISLQTWLIIGRSGFRFSQATKCSPASGICRSKCLLKRRLNCSMKNSRRSEYRFSHPFDVAEKKSLGQKTGECRLIDGG